MDETQMIQLTLPLPIPYYLVIRSEFSFDRSTGFDCELSSVVVDVLASAIEAHSIASGLKYEEPGDGVEYQVQMVHIVPDEVTNKPTVESIDRTFKELRAS